MNLTRVTALRQRRQHLTMPADTEAYDALFRGMSPVHTMYWTEPGAPPLLQHRAAFDDWAYNDRRRAQRKILKGRYQNGSVGYVDVRDLELYACAYCKPIPSPDFEQLALLELLTREGPLTIGSIKDITGMKVKHITPILHRLQQAFLVFEDQIDCEGDRAWYVFESEFSEIDLNRYTRVEAIAQIITRFLPLAVCAEADGIKSFYGFTAKDIREALDTLRADGAVKSVAINNRTFYFMREDEAYLFDETVSCDADKPVSGAILLHRSDFWVKSEEYALKKRFKNDNKDTPGDGEPSDVLYYIAVDGEIAGVVVGRFRFGPHVIADVRMDWPDDAKKTARKDEILAAVQKIFDPAESPAKRFDGVMLPPVREMK